MARDILSEYGQDADKPQAPVATSGGCTEARDVMAYQPPVGPIGISNNSGKHQYSHNSASRWRRYCCCGIGMGILELTKIAVFCASASAQTLLGIATSSTGGGAPTTTCPFGAALADGCNGAQAHGTIINSHLFDPQAVTDLQVVGGSGYTAGTYTWNSSGGGCSVGASGTITVSAGGLLGGDTNGKTSNYTITNGGTGCTSRPTISVPAGAGSGTGGSITPTVYQGTPHNNATAKWNIPGVDYPVGYDTSLTLADPTLGGTLPACATFASGTVTVNSNNCTINGFNFALHGTVLSASGKTGTVITNNSFACVQGTTTALGLVNITGASSTATINYNTFNGGYYYGTGCLNPNGQNAVINVNSSGGTITIEYNYCFGADSKCVEFSGWSTGTFTAVEEFNFWVDYGVGNCSGCSHGEAEYTYSGATGVINYTIKFNVTEIHFWASPNNSTATLAIEADSTVINNPDVEYNMAVVPGTGTYTAGTGSPFVSASIYCGRQTDPGVGAYTGTTTMANNYVDYSGSFFPYNTSSGNCQAAGGFTTTADINAGTNHACNISGTCN